MSFFSKPHSRNPQIALGGIWICITWDLCFEYLALKFWSSNFITGLFLIHYYAVS